MTAPCLRDVIDQNAVVGEVKTGAKRFWTGRELKLLREHYPAGGINACLPVLPGRTASTIYQRANALGLRSPRQPTGKREAWTSNEHIDASIRRVYQREPSKGDITALAVAVMRPRWWVSKRARALGLVQPRFKEPRWSAEEKAFVAERATQNPATIRRAMKANGWTRTETAIVVQIKRLGVSRVADDPDTYTARSLAEMMGVDSHAVTAWIAKGWLKAREGDGKTAPWKIKRKDVRAFVIENTAAVDIRKVDKFWFVELLTGEAA